MRAYVDNGVLTTAIRIALIFGVIVAAFSLISDRVAEQVAAVHGPVIEQPVERKTVIGSLAAPNGVAPALMAARMAHR